MLQSTGSIAQNERGHCNDVRTTIKMANLLYNSQDTDFFMHFILCVNYFLFSLHPLLLGIVGRGDKVCLTDIIYHINGPIQILGDHGLIREPMNYSRGMALPTSFKLLYIVISKIIQCH